MFVNEYLRRCGAVVSSLYSSVLDNIVSCYIQITIYIPDIGRGAFGACSEVYLKDQKSHLAIHDLRTLRPPSNRWFFIIGEDVNMPKISVLMPIYKTKEEYLRAAIESILHQTYTDFEFLILDDCPEDLRENVVKSYRDNRIKYSINEQNLGITGSRNKLIEMAKGEYLAVMDHDDISLPERFVKEVEILDNNPNIGVVGSKVHEIIANRDIEEPENDKDIKILLMKRCAIIHPSAMIRKSVLDEHNIRYKAYYSPSEDHQLWCSLISVTNFYNIQEVLLNYRDWAGNTTHNQRDKMTKGTQMIYFENEINHPELWKTFEKKYAQHITYFRLFNFIPIVKIIENSKRKQIFLFNHISLYSVVYKDKVNS